MKTILINNEKTLFKYMAELTVEAKQLTRILKSFQGEAANQEKIVLRDIHHIHVVNAPDIIYCKAERSYTRVFLVDGNEILISKNLKSFEDLLQPHGFFRIHHSYLINPDHIQRIDKQAKSGIILSNDHELPYSKSKRELLFNYLSNL